MQEIRCNKCGKLLYKMVRLDERHIGYTKDDEQVKPSDVVNGIIECKCPRCGEMNVRKENVEDENIVRTCRSRKDDVPRK